MADSETVALYLSGVGGDERVLLSGVESGLTGEGELSVAHLGVGQLRVGGASGAPPGLFLILADGSVDPGVPRAEEA